MPMSDCGGYYGQGVRLAVLWEGVVGCPADLSRTVTAMPRALHLC
jgi:hypothetical protein